MDEKDEQRVKHLIQEFFSSEWQRQCDALERKTMTAVTAAIDQFKESLDTRLGREHSENRTRFQDVDAKVGKSIEVANTAVSQNTAILIGQDRQERTMGNVLTTLDTFREEVAEWRGIRKTEHKAEKESREAKSKAFGYIKWIVGIGASGGVAKWISSLFHHQPK